ncbi:hypothetical protein RSAG8_04428, partial [Rhizoctonia solani AG-8 WAC10335]
MDARYDRGKSSWDFVWGADHRGWPWTNMSLCSDKQPGHIRTPTRCLWLRLEPHNSLTCPKPFASHFTLADHPSSLVLDYPGSSRGVLGRLGMNLASLLDMWRSSLAQNSYLLDDRGSPATCRYESGVGEMRGACLLEFSTARATRFVNWAKSGAHLAHRLCTHF